MNQAICQSEKFFAALAVLECFFWHHVFAIIKTIIVPRVQFLPPSLIPFFVDTFLIHLPVSLQVFTNYLQNINRSNINQSCQSSSTF